MQRGRHRSPLPLHLGERRVIVYALVVLDVDLEPRDPRIPLQCHGAIANNVFDERRLVVCLHGHVPFVLALADKGYRVALGQDPHLRAGLNVCEGRITYKAVADALKLPYVPAEQALRM